MIHTSLPFRVLHICYTPQIEQALRRLSESDCGVCLGCREDISIERLKVQPEALYCVECKDRNESSIRLRGGVVFA